MSEPSGNKRLQILLAVVAVAVVAVAIAVLSGDPEPDPVAESADTAPSETGSASSGSGQSIGHDHEAHGEEPGRYEQTVLDAGPGARKVYFPGEGWATVVDDPNADMPPELESIPDNPNPPEAPPPELPQTAQWKLGKTERITEVMTQRVDRLEERLAEARRAGDDAEVQRIEVLLRRSRMRIDRLEQEAEELRAQAADGPSEEEIIRQWEEEHGMTVEEARERRRRLRAAGEQAPAPPGSP